ncbi:hypothetical protein DERF_006050 [Dermatophagoides farinae]|uniref:Protein kinase domain-containing protein n=1 Tax=Dermatophagoides farinae TaxID=6954 RepID=A0A922I5C7_DERFA|nr:hypothetical protein DERF_006050 [Dermatophagoides farinae]
MVQKRNNRYKAKSNVDKLSQQTTSPPSKQMNITNKISVFETTDFRIRPKSSLSIMVKNKIPHHHQLHYDELPPLPFKSYYTNSSWINKQFDSTNSLKNHQNPKSISMSKHYPYQYHHPNQNTNDTNLDILTNNRRPTSPFQSDLTSNLIHNSIMYYVNQIRPNTPQNRRRLYEKPTAPPEPVGGVVITPFEVLMHGYLLHRVVGRGSFSTLYEASRLFVSRGGVACKHVRIGRAEDIRPTDSDGQWRLQMQQNFIEEEIRILRQIRHPNIIQLYEIIIGDDNRDYYIMMKFAANKTIAHYLYQFYQKPLPETYAKRWTRQLMSAIQYIHEEHRVAHRDLKLENFLLDEKYVALLTDFGLAISLSIHSDPFSSSSSSSSSHQHHTGIANNHMLGNYCCTSANKSIDDRTKRIEILLSTQCGSTEYMAPEILNQELQSNIDTLPWCTYDPFRSDIYSMGVCLFEMLNYHRPFRWSSYKINNNRNGENNLVWQQRNRQYRFNKRIYLTEECRDLIDEMLEPRLAFRPTARQVLDHRWFKYSIR